MDGQKIFRIDGIDIRIHYTWYFIFFLLSYSLAVDFFPVYYPGLSVFFYWASSICSVLLLFASVLLHELSHSFVAKHYNINVKNITLFFFGGVAGISTEEMRPSVEFEMAIAGPLFSLAFAAFCYSIFLLFPNITIVNAVMFYLYKLNLVLGIFNLIPAYPLDGGRVLRSILHEYFKDLELATKYASFFSRLFSLAFILAGIVLFSLGNFTGLWFVFIGGFIYFMSGMAFEQIVIKKMLDKYYVKDLMHLNYKTISVDAKIADFIHSLITESGNLFVVNKKKEFLGLVDLEKLKNIPNNEYSIRNVSELLVKGKDLPRILISDSPFRALEVFSESKLNVLPVLHNGKIVGAIHRSTIINLISLKIIYDVNYSPKH